MKKISIITIALFATLFFTQVGNSRTISAPIPILYDDGGIVIFAEGLTDKPIEVAFKTLADSKNLSVNLSVYDAAAGLLYSRSYQSTHIVVDDLELSSGQYYLEIKVNGKTEIRTFVR